MPPKKITAPGAALQLLDVNQETLREARSQKRKATSPTLHEEELDQEISSLLADSWTIDRLAKPDLVILRLGLFEMQYVDAVPTAVAINEALELAKTFSNDKSRRFINGALGKFERQLAN